MTAVIQVENLSKRYHDFTMAGLSLDVQGGVITGVFGPNGSGKTTLMKLITRQIRAHSGTVSALGLGFDEHEKEIKNRIGYVAQEPEFYWSKTATWIGRFCGHLFENWDGGLFHRLLEQYGVGRDTKAKNLSRGRKTLLSLAIALSHGAEILVLDEPTAGLDMIRRRDVLKLLREFVADGDRTVLVSSHLTDGLDALADIVCFLNNGTLVIQENRDELFERWKKIHFKEGGLDPEVVRQLRCTKNQPFGSFGFTDDFAGLQPLLEDALTTGDVRVGNADLDDILICLLEGA
jgi:ABC-2 type transport system ATP-binding protein